MKELENQIKEMFEYWLFDQEKIASFTQSVDAFIRAKLEHRIEAESILFSNLSGCISAWVVFNNGSLEEKEYTEREIVAGAMNYICYERIYDDMKKLFEERRNIK